MFNNNLLMGAAAAASGADLVSVGNSALFKTASSQYLSRTPGSNGNNKIATFSTWFYHMPNGLDQTLFAATAGAADIFQLYIDSNDDIILYNYSSGYDWQYVTDMKFRDNGWIHFCCGIDTSDTVSTNRVILEINGVRVTDFSTASAPSLNFVNDFNTASNPMRVASYDGSHNFGNNYMAETVWIDGTRYSASDFGQFDSSGLYWTPKSSASIKALTFGTNGFYLDNTTNAQTDASGEGNNFTNNNTVTTTTHTPTNIFGLANPLVKSAITYSNGNKTVATTTSANSRAMSTLPIIGKMKIEVTINSGSTVIVGLQSLTQGTAIEAYYYGSTGAVGGVTGSAGATFGASDVITMLVDDDAGTIEFKKNNTSQGGARTINASGYTAGEGSMCFEYGDGTTSNAVNVTIAVESGDWDYSDTATFLECSTESIASATTRTASDSKKYFDTILYEGNGEQQRVGQFQPFTDSFTIAKSALFNSASSENFSRSWGTPTNNKIFTFSTWFKLCDQDDDVTLFSSNNTSMIDIDSSNNIRFWQYSSSAFQFNLITDLEYTDNSQWANLVVMMDTTQSTAANRTKMYLNGVQITSFSTESYIAQDATPHMNNASYTHYIGQTGGSSNYWEGYLAETAFLDGQTLTASSFGSTDTSSGRWVPKSITGLTYGDRGFLLDYSNGSDLGEDQKNSNDWTNNNTVTQVVDSPTTNVATLDPNSNTTSGGSTALSNGNRTSTQSSGGTTYVGGILVPESGKFVWEVTVTNVVEHFYIGIKDIDASNTASSTLSDDAIMYQNDGTIEVDGTTYSSSPATYTDGDVIRVEWDVNVKIEWFKNNSSQGSYTLSKSSITYKPFFVYNDDTASFTVNFGSSSFAHTPTTGYSALTQDNLTSTDQFISAFSWIKNRDATDNHMLFDRVRGVKKDIHSNTTALEVTNVNTLQSFLAGGVQVGNDVEVNTANESYVLWNWMMETTGSGTSNEDGSVNTTRTLVDTTLGVSINLVPVPASGDFTIGHGLGAIPKFIIVKGLEAADNWVIHARATMSDTTDYILFTAAAQVNSGVNVFGASLPTSTVLGLTAGSTAAASKDAIVYAFADSQFISIGSYTGNENVNGTFVPTLNSLGVPIQPVWVMVKNTAQSRSWNITDTARNPYNVANLILEADTTTAQQTGSDTLWNMDIVTGGFKLRSSHETSNGAETMIYLAFGTPIIDVDGRIITGR